MKTCGIGGKDRCERTDGHLALELRRSPTLCVGKWKAFDGYDTMKGIGNISTSRKGTRTCHH
jgi:hypothetical protein